MKKNFLLAAAMIAGIVVILNYLSKNKPEQNAAIAALSKLPISFIENQGRLDPKIKFYFQGHDRFVTFTDQEIVYAPDLKQKFVGANPKVEIQGLTRAEGKVNYLIGKDQNKWKTNIPTYDEIVYKDLYPGIDLVFSGMQGRLKSEFRLVAGADYKKIVVAYGGIHEMTLSDAGDLVIQSASHEIRELKPLIYQIRGDQRVAVEGKYVVDERGYRFEVGVYDSRQPLVIDPVLVYSTYLGGSESDWGNAIAVDSSGSVYITGFTNSSNFPTASPFQANFGGGDFDIFVTKLNASGSALIYSTFIGGSGKDMVSDIALDSSKNAYITGWTDSGNFPTALPIQASNGGSIDAFVTKLNASGSALIYSTYFGGSSNDYGTDIVVSLGKAYITGSTYSINFPTTALAFQTTFGSNPDYMPDAFITVLNRLGSALIYSTFLGGDLEDGGYGIAVNASGHAYITGFTNSSDFPTASPFQASNGGGLYEHNDAFITKLNASGSALIYSTYLGGSHNDRANAIAIDSSGNSYITGKTHSHDFPTASPFQASNGGNPGGGISSTSDAFVTKLNASGSALIYSTYLGGTWDDIGMKLAVDSTGRAYIVGFTHSFNGFPTALPIQASNGGGIDFFVTKLNASGSALIYSTYLGGWGEDRGYGLALDSGGKAYITGAAGSSELATFSSFQNTKSGPADAFVAKIDEPLFSPDLIIQSASISASAAGGFAGQGLQSGVKLHVTIHNQGTMAAVGPFSIGLRKNPSTKEGYDTVLQVLSSGQSLGVGATTVTKVFSVPAIDTIELKIDVANNVQENNEGNNIIYVPSGN